MDKIPDNTTNEQAVSSKPNSEIPFDDALRLQAFDNSFQANIISTVGSGKIILVNNAACNLLGYSKKELLTKSRADIFDINEEGFKKMLKQREADGKVKAQVTSIQKDGKLIPCEITSAIFIDKDGIEKAITTIEDMSQNILKQKYIDTKKEKIIVANTILAQSRLDTATPENNEWIKYIAKASYDVMWDWDIASGEIYVGDSIEEVFGYKVHNNKVHYTNFVRCLPPEEKNSVEIKLSKALTSGNKHWDDSFKFIRGDGTIAHVNSRAIITRDEKGKALHLIGAMLDVSRLEEMKKKLEDQNTVQEEQNDKFILAAKFSFDVIWDWNLLTNELFMGDGFEEMFGYILKDNKGKITDWSSHLHPDDKETVEQGLYAAIASSASQWQRDYRFIRADGSIAKVFDRASIIRQPDGKANRMIGAMKDLSRQKELEENLAMEISDKRKLIAEHNENLKLIFNSSPDILLDFDLLANKLIINDAYEKEFGYKITGNMSPEENWINHIHPADKEAVMHDYRKMLASEASEWKYSCRFLRADNSVANILGTCVILRDADGKACRMIGSIQDISKQTVLEDQLEQEIKLKEKKIAEAMQEAKDSERSDIGRELHDNINQLLSVSKLYLDMAKTGGENTTTHLKRSSEFTLKAIEEIRKLTKGLTTDIIKNLGLCQAIEKIIQDTREVNPVKITYNLDRLIEHSLNDKFKLNVYRIVQEQLTNILKHAKATEVFISLSQDTKDIVLTICDNGVGFDADKKRTGIGIDNIKSRAASYHGKVEIVSQPGEGCIMTITTLMKARKSKIQKVKTFVFFTIACN